jgi:hypothetical protein
MNIRDIARRKGKFKKRRGKRGKGSYGSIIINVVKE